MIPTEGIEPAGGSFSNAATEETATAIPALATPDTFPFPYPKPYGIQLDLMRTVFEAIENRKIAIVCPPCLYTSRAMTRRCQA